MHAASYSSQQILYSMINVVHPQNGAAALSVV